MKAENSDRGKWNKRIACGVFDLLLPIAGAENETMEQLRSRLTGIAFALRRERQKGLMRHWSYDLNRHIALKRAQDTLRDEIAFRKDR